VRRIGHSHKPLSDQGTFILQRWNAGAWQNTDAFAVSYPAHVDTTKTLLYDRDLRCYEICDEDPPHTSAYSPVIHYPPAP